MRKKLDTQTPSSKSSNKHYEFDPSRKSSNSQRSQFDQKSIFKIANIVKFRFIYFRCPNYFLKFSKALLNRIYYLLYFKILC